MTRVIMGLRVEGRRENEPNSRRLWDYICTCVCVPLSHQVSNGSRKDSPLLWRAVNQIYSLFLIVGPFISLLQMTLLSANTRSPLLTWRGSGCQTTRAKLPGRRKNKRPYERVAV